jgi:hypothetical protein
MNAYSQIKLNFNCLYREPLEAEAFFNEINETHDPKIVLYNEQKFVLEAVESNSSNEEV